MANPVFDYVIISAGLAGASAVQGIREHDSNGSILEADLVIAGVGIRAATQLAEHAGLAVDNDVVVNEFLQSSHPDIYAAGDIASFPCQALGRGMRVEHRDNALNQGRCAGRDMDGARQAYTYMPYLFPICSNSVMKRWVT